MAFKNYYYDRQVEKYYLQFMAVFAGLQVEIGLNDRSPDEHKLIPVPIMNGNRDRVSGWIKGGFTQNKPLRLPMMSSNITNIVPAPELQKGVGAVRRESYLPRGGVIPDDIKVVKQYMPIPYYLTADVSIWTSNHHHRYQILEQILTVFDPIVQIQKTDAVFDWTKITTIGLEGINYEDNYPIGVDRRILVTTLSFHFPIYLSPPANIKEDFIKDVFVRIGAVSQAATSNEEMVAELDAQGIMYEQWFNGDDLNLPEF